jgi:hypothetical protein
MKYIIFDVNGLECPVIFSELLTHNQVRQSFPDYYTPISAGFCRASVEDTGGDEELVIRAWGKSVSLNLSSGVNDTEILTKCNEWSQ